MGKCKVVVVGAGVTGAVAALTVAKAGHPVTLLDDTRGGSGTPCSAGLILPGSLRAGEGTKAGLTLLHKVFGAGLCQVQFEGGTLYQLSPVTIYHALAAEERIERVKETVVRVGAGWVLTGDGRTRAGRILVATGAWTNELLASRLDFPYAVGAETGYAWLYKGTVTPSMKPWGRGKQLTVFNRDPKVVWGGDGSSLAPNAYTPKRVSSSAKRVEKAVSELGIEGGATAMLVGLYPVIKGVPGVFCRVYHHTWVATGAGKSGTIVAATQARDFYTTIK